MWIWFLFSFSKKWFPPNRSSKTNLRLKTRTEWPGPISNPTAEICSPESSHKTRIDPNQTIPDPKFSIMLLIFAWQAYWIKDRLAWNYPDRNSPDPNQTDPKCHLIQNMTWPKLNPINTKIEWSIYQAYLQVRAQR